MSRDLSGAQSGGQGEDRCPGVLGITSEGGTRQGKAARTRGSWGLVPRKATTSRGMTAIKEGQGDLSTQPKPPDHS